MMQFDEGIYDVVSESETQLVSLASVLTEGPPSFNLKEALTLQEKEVKKRAHCAVDTNDMHLMSCNEVATELTRIDVLLGIDRMALSFPVKYRFDDAPVKWRETSVSEPGKWMRRWSVKFSFMKGEVYLQVTQSFTGLFGYCDFNPSSLLQGPKGAHSVTLSQSLEVLTEVAEELQKYVMVISPSEQWSLSRLDVNQTVNPVADVQRLLSIAQFHPFNNQVKVGVTRSYKGIETVACRSKKSGGFSIYDKAKQAKLSEPTLRFEITARRKVLRAKCPLVENLTEDRCRVLFDFYLGEVIYALRDTPTTVIDDVFAVPRDLKTLIELLGRSVLNDLGYFVSPSDYAIRKKYRPFMKKYQIAKVSDFLDAV